MLDEATVRYWKTRIAQKDVDEPRTSVPDCEQKLEREGDRWVVYQRLARRAGWTIGSRDWGPWKRKGEL